MRGILNQRTTMRLVNDQYAEEVQQQNAKLIYETSQKISNQLAQRLRPNLNQEDVVRQKSLEETQATQTQ